MPNMLTITFLLLAITVNAQTPVLKPPFQDITQQAGINHRFRVYEGMFGGGACVIDFNRDGFEDVFIMGGMNPDMLYKNNGPKAGPMFTNVYEKSGLTVTKGYVTQGAAAADVNRDGWVDLFVTTITSKTKKLPVPRAMNLLFLNNKNGTFRDATREYGLDQLVSFSTGASFGDINADGFPDLYVGNYFNDFKGELTVINDATIVGSTQTSKGYLLLNKGGKKFKDVYDDYGLTHKGFGFGGVFSDYDNDGDQDLIINHDFGYKRTPNLLLQNQYGRSRFLDVATEMKMDLKINSMGTAVGDYNNDGWMDYYFTNIRFNRFMVNNGPGKPFTDQTQQAGLDQFAISWGANFADFDHDGDLDLFVANGDLNPNCVPMADFYFENQNGHFQDNSRAYGLNDYGIGRGSVVFDYDNDGDLDLLVVNQQPILDYPTPSFTRLYQNNSAKGNWLKIALKGIQAESQGIGSRILVVAGSRRMIREIDGGASSHISQNSTIAHFGLGAATKIDSVVVTWTGGKRQTLTNQKPNQLLTITEIPDEPTNPLLWIGATLLLIGVAVAGWRFWQSRTA
ncbi:MAG: CRTAC1 family protein [Rudanella sp.]|nr:CRTAC1 family protein [Rudanella sp.]